MKQSDHATLFEENDHSLVAMSQRGDREAFSTLVGRHHASLTLFFRRLGADPEHADDGTQETWLRVWSFRSRYRPLGTFRTFLYSVARNVWYDRLRKVRRSRELVSVDALKESDRIVPALTVSGPFEAYDRRADLHDALDRLPERMRVVLVLNVYQGLKYAEIAEILDIPVGTVKTRVFHAVRRLRDVLSRSRERHV